MPNLIGNWEVYDYPPLEAYEHIGLLAFDSEHDIAWLTVDKESRTRTGNSHHFITQLSRILFFKDNQWGVVTLQQLGIASTSGIVAQQVVSGFEEDLWLLVSNQELERRLVHFRGTETTILDHGTSDIFPLIALEPILNVSKIGEVWLTGDMGAMRFADGNWDVFTEENSLLTGRVTAITIDDSNRIWFGVDAKDKSEVVALSATGWETKCVIDLPHRNTELRSIVIDSDSKIWLGWFNPENYNRGGLWVVGANGNIESKFTTANSQLPSNSIIGMVVDSIDRTWVGTTAGIAVFQGTKSACWIAVARNSVQNALTRQEAQSIYRNHDRINKVFLKGQPHVDLRDRIWMMSSDGLAIFKQ